MYCQVFYKENVRRHTSHYLYKSMEKLVPGDIVVVPAGNKEKKALVTTVFEHIPKQYGSLEYSRLKRLINEVWYPVREPLTWDESKSFMLGLIDDYKEAFLTAENVCCIFNNLGKNKNFCISFSSEEIKECFLTVCKCDSNDETEFWKQLKNLESYLYCGRSLIYRYNYGSIKNDEVELADDYLKVEPELNRKIYEQIGKGGYMGYCHLYWNTKKRILREEYGIDWKSPAELNKNIYFD